MPGARAIGVAFPDARLVAARVQEVGVAVPPVPVADDGDALRVRRPDRESRAGRVDVRTKPLVQALVRALAEEVRIEIGKRGRQARARGFRSRGRFGTRIIRGYRAVVFDCITRRA
jgi:hypothetical protein